MSGGGEEAGCDLCGLPLPAQEYALHTAERDYRFCCEGCKGIFRMLNGLDDGPAVPGSGFRVPGSEER